MAPPKQFSLIIPQYKAAALTSGFSYAQFIENVFKANKRQLKHVNRDEVDRVWKEMVPKWIPHDERRCQKLVAEVSSSTSGDIWHAFFQRQANSQLQDASGRISRVATDSAGASLVLPMKFKVSSHRAGYRYCKFAKQMQEENPHLELTREIVDKAAEDVIRKQRSAHCGHASTTKLLREVIGAESDEYWATKGGAK